MFRKEHKPTCKKPKLDKNTITHDQICQSPQSTFLICVYSDFLNFAVSYFLFIYVCLSVIFGKV